MVDVGEALRERIDGAQTLGVQPSVALQLIELGKDPETEFDDYVHILSLSRSLSAKLLAITNSSWFAPRRPITTLKRAVTMLGLRQVRTLAVSYCLEGLHNTLELEREDAVAYWEAALCRAIAARELASAADPKRADEVFAVALLQDMAVCFMAELDSFYISRLQYAESSVAEQLIYEVQHFGMDHAAAGGLVAEAFALPEAYCRAISAHHGEVAPNDATSDDAVQQATRLVAWLPHDIRCWTHSDIARFGELIEERFPGRWSSAEAFADHVQADFTALVAQLSANASEPTVLRRLMRQASAQNAECVAELVREVQVSTRQQEIFSGMFESVVTEQIQAEHRADHDPLTGLLNREGFERRFADLVTGMPGTDVPVGLALFDCDQLKTTNDKHGHDAGDALLRAVVARLRAGVRDNDLVCRWGGDEFAVLFLGMAEDTFVEVARRAQQNVARDPVVRRGVEMPASVTGGLVWEQSVGAGFDLAELITRADANLYAAKRRQRGSLVCDGKQVPAATA